MQDADRAKLTAMLQKTEMKVRNLERTLAQKTKENDVSAAVVIDAELTVFWCRS